MLLSMRSACRYESIRCRSLKGFHRRQSQGHGANRGQSETFQCPAIDWRLYEERHQIIASRCEKTISAFIHRIRSPRMRNDMTALNADRTNVLIFFLVSSPAERKAYQDCEYTVTCPRPLWPNRPPIVLPKQPQSVAGYSPGLRFEKFSVPG